MGTSQRRSRRAYRPQPGHTSRTRYRSYARRSRRCELVVNSAFEVIDKRFRDYVHALAHVEQLCTGMRWAEGPVYFGDTAQLIWSDIPNDRMMRWVEGGSVSVFRELRRDFEADIRKYGGDNEEED